MEQKPASKTRVVVLASILAVLVAVVVTQRLYIAFVEPAMYGVDPDPAPAVAAYRVAAKKMGVQQRNPIATLALDSDHSSRRTWVIRDAGICEVHFDRYSYEIRFIYNEMTPASQIPESQNKQLSKTEVLERARLLGSRIGLHLPEEDPSVSYSSHRSEQSGDAAYQLKWTRTEKGVPFKDEWVSLRLDGRTGSLISYNNNTQSWAPATVPGIRAKWAKEVASELALREGFKIKGSPRLYVVTPNYRWTPSARAHPRFGESRLAWVFNFTKPDSFGKLEGGAGEIWVDGIDARMLGGEESK